MLLWLLFSSVVISRVRDFPILQLLLLLPCLAQKEFRSFFYCAVLHKSSSIAGCEERHRLFSSNVVLILVFCFGVAAAWRDVAAAPVFDEVMKAIWEVADFPHGPPPLAGIFVTHFLSIAIELYSKLDLENGKVCMYVQRCDWFDLHPLSRAQSWRLVTAIHRKVMVRVKHFVSKHSHKVATATLIVMLPSIFVVVEDWFLCKFHRYLILIEGTVLNVMMFNRRLS